jgi:hypothetical protein
MTWEAVQPIVTPLTYRDLIIQKCGMREARPLAGFMRELRAAASAEVVAQAQAEAARIREEERDTELEYICTAELFDSTERNADDALAAWSRLKGGG